MPQDPRIVGYARDASVILVIVAAGLYILSHPDDVDAFLNWLLRRN
jgi:hypothetical protein